MIGSLGPIITEGRHVGAFRGWLALWDSLRILDGAGALVVMAILVRFEVNRARRQYFPMSRAGMWCVACALAYVAFTEIGRIGFEVAPFRLVVGIVAVAFGVRYAVVLNRMPSVRPDPWRPPRRDEGGFASIEILAVLVGGGVLAQTGSPSNAGLPPPWNYVIQWGPLGVGAFALAADILVPARRVKKIEAERDDAVAYAREVETKARTDVLPLLRDVQHDLQDGQKVSAEAAKTLADFRAWMTYGRPGERPG